MSNVTGQAKRWSCVRQTGRTVAPDVRGCGNVWTDQMEPMICPNCLNPSTEIKIVRGASARTTGQSMSGSLGDGFYRLTSEDETYFVTVTNGQARFRGRNLSLPVSECIANGDKFEVVP
jgi:hypothetical protein